MATSPEIKAIAVDFWARAGATTKFPRSLEPSVYALFPLAVIRVAHLSTASVAEWLIGRGIHHSEDGGARLLHGYLVATGGVGVVFLDGTDDENEQRFSLAHEVAHFMLDYMVPRRRAIERLGPGIAEVMDGSRPPTPEERLGGVLRGIRLGVYTHLAKRSEEGEVLANMVFHIEDRADQLALELLAPFGSVVAAAQRLTPGGLPLPSAVAELLASRYGLPPRSADAYGRVIAGALKSGRTFRDWLGVV